MRPTPAPRAPYRLPTRNLLALTAAVALAHVALLGGIPADIGFMAKRADALEKDTVAMRFDTRTIAAEPAAPAQTNAPKARLARPASVAKSAPPAAAESTPLAPNQPTQGELPATAGQANASELTDSVLPPPLGNQPAGPATPSPAPVAASPLAPATAAASAAEVQNAKKVNYADPVRLLFDGRGEEGGYKKYAAGGELLWLPQAMQYTAKLEITALFFRIRTWTSKGELTEGGLQPLRFGDKPRGAEQATHFQRDKGIISFSANNPDVPLQPGAQDKLSALVQLSAMVAGEPERYPAGSSIRFQAADAHRAEIWNFRAGATETLELPGGTLQAAKFTKDPTVEFDQRVEVWLAHTLQYLPVRIRVTESNGNFVDLLWRSTQKPD